MLAAQPINDNQFSVIGSVLMLMALPQAYRGYVFSFVGDELCYYLGSRFYSPRLGRFINADKYFDTGTGVLGTNMYAYCNNNPIMYTDPTGEYRRKDAVKYAKKWTAGSNNPYLIIFNPKYHYYPNGDCANFVSQCLHAGGIVMTLRWYSFRLFAKDYVASAWSQIKYQSQFFAQSKYSSGIGFFSFCSINSYGNPVVFSKKEIIKQIANIIRMVDIGDILYLDTDLNKKEEYNHATIITKIENGDIFYAGHTSNRYDKSLTESILEGSVQYCFVIHIKNYAV